MSPSFASKCVLLGVILAVGCQCANAFTGGGGLKVSALLKKHEPDINTLKQKASEVGAESLAPNDVFYLRYCLDYDGGKKGDINDATAVLADNIKWRMNEGKSICDSAREAVQKASESGKWDNDPVREAAPHASIVNKYITPSQILTTTSTQGDLVNCIQAGKIDDLSLMSEVTPEELVDFFLYCREVHSLVADKRSMDTDNLVSVITANDLAGVSLLGDKTFRTALSKSSTRASVLYPGLSGPTLLLNLPRLLGALVKLFTPLFPPDVRKKLKFEQGPLKDIGDLTDLLSGSAKDTFQKELDDLVYTDN